MRIKQYLRLHVQRVVGHMKSLGLLFWVPIAILDVFLPLLLLAGYFKEGISENLQQTFQDFTRMLVPFLSAWWPLFLSKEYLEADGNELLFVCKNRGKLGDFLQAFVLYLCNAALIYAVVIPLLFPQMALEPVFMLGACIWYFGVFYFLAFLTQSVTINLMVLLLYTLANVLIRSDTVMFPLYYSGYPVEAPVLLMTALPLTAAGVVLILLGTVLNKKKLRFN